MNVSLYLHFEKIRVAVYTMEVETIVIYNLEILVTSIAFWFSYNSIG